MSLGPPGLVGLGLQGQAQQEVPVGRGVPAASRAEPCGGKSPPTRARPWPRSLSLLPARGRGAVANRGTATRERNITNRPPYGHVRNCHVQPAEHGDIDCCNQHKSAGPMCWHCHEKPAYRNKPGFCCRTCWSQGPTPVVPCANTSGQARGTSTGNYDIIRSSPEVTT